MRRTDGARALLRVLGACAMLAWAFAARWGNLAERFVIVAAAGLVAGESMAGVGISLWQLLR